MKRQFTWFGLLATLIISNSTFFVGCNKDELNDVVEYHGQVVYINTTNPFADLTVKVTNGKDTHCQTQTDAGGLFSLKVRVNEIDGEYYLLAGDSTCIPKKVGLGGYGQAEVDLGVIEVEGPSKPTVKTTPIQSLKADEVIMGGEVMTDGRLRVTARGICYGPDPYPTVDGLHTTDGAGLGAFTSTLKNLEYNTIYYARAYATNKMGTAYDTLQIKFTTEEGVAVVVTDSVIRITAHSAKCKGKVVSDGGFSVTKRGTCWSKRPDPTVDDDCTDDGSGIGEFTSTMKDLTENTTYYVRTYATNSTKTTYGEQIIITTLDGLAVVKTDSITSVTATGFTAYGTVVSDCDIAVTERGFCYATTQYPTTEDATISVGRGLGSYQGNVRNLQIGTTYYVRAFATNETGTTYSKQISITTTDGLPIVKTKQVSSTATTIRVEGEVTETWGYNVSERGFVYSQQNSEPTTEDIKIPNGKGMGVFSSTIIDLQPETEYFTRSYAINENGTSYGQVIKIATKDGKAVVTLGNITDTTAITASVSIKVTDLSGASELLESGVCWSTLPTPTIEDQTNTAGGKQLNNDYMCYLANLQPNTTYYVRAYATTNVATSYSAQKSFITKDGLPTVETLEVESITRTSAISGGNITDDGGFPITERGVCWSTFPYPTISDTKTSDGTGGGYYSSQITGINLQSTNYYIRAYATNINGTVYGEQVLVTKEMYAYSLLPIVSYGGYKYHVSQDLGEMDWQTAVNTCQNYTLAGYDDWYLPDMYELEQIARQVTTGWVQTYYDDGYGRPGSAYYYANYWTSSKGTKYPYVIYIYNGSYEQTHLSQNSSWYIINARVRAVRKDKIQ